MGLLFVSIIIFGTNMVTLDMTVEPHEGAHFSDPPSATLGKSGPLWNPDYYVDTFLFIRSEDSEVKSGTLQVRIEVDENGVVYESQILNVTHRLLPRETWTRMVHLDVREFATSTVTITLLEDDDGDGTYTVERDRWTKTVRVYPTGGNAFDTEEEAGTGLLDRLPEVPIDLNRRPTGLGY
jgi:hypothetical protein